MPVRGGDPTCGPPAVRCRGAASAADSPEAPGELVGQETAAAGAGLTSSRRDGLTGERPGESLRLARYRHRTQSAARAKALLMRPSRMPWDAGVGSES